MGMRVEHLPPTATAEEVHAVLDRDAALIIDDLADVGTIDRIAAEMAPFIEATPAGSDEFSGRNTRGRARWSPARRRVTS